MATGYTIETQRRSIQVRSSGAPLDVQVVGFNTEPSGVYIELPIPYTAWLALQTDFFVAPFALEVEGWLATDGVIGAQWTQDLDAAQLLVDYIEFTLQVSPPSTSQTGPMQTTVRVPFSYFGEDRPLHHSVSSLIQPALDTLRATAGL